MDRMSKLNCTRYACFSTSYRTTMLRRRLSVEANLWVRRWSWTGFIAILDDHDTAGVTDRGVCPTDSKIYAMAFVVFQLVAREDRNRVTHEVVNRPNRVAPSVKVARSVPI